MIELRVAPYCHDCVNFEAEVSVELKKLDTLWNEMSMEFKDQLDVHTIVRCRNCSKCADMFNYLKSRRETE